MSTSGFKVIDLFSGVGGLSLGAARADMPVAVAVENDEQAIRAHKKNFPSTTHVDCDVRKVSSHSLKERANLVDGESLVIIGGPPCQGFSSIGYSNTADPRNKLFLKFFSIVRDIQPVMFLAENVPGIMNQSNDEIRDAALDFVRNDYELLPPVKVVAKDFGVPTTRTRYLFIGYKTSFFNSISQDSLTTGKTRVRVKEALFGLPKRIRADWQREDQSWRQVQYPQTNTRYWRSIKANVPTDVGDAKALKLLKDHGLVSGFLGTLHSDRIKRRYAVVAQGKTDKISKARRLEWDGYCPTLRAGTGSDRGSYQAVRPLHPSANRVISPREAARLQGFPDWFQFSPTKWHSFRQIGNSVCPILAETVFKSIIKLRRK